MEREQWLEQRRKAIGSSDAPAIVLGGLIANNPEAQKIKGVFKTPLHVYLEKRGLYNSGDDNRKAWGRRLEVVVAQAFVEEAGLPVTPNGTQSFVHPEHTWMAATPDFLVDEPDGDASILEVKTASSAIGWGPSGSDEFPEGYLVQVLHQMHCVRVPRAYLAVLIGGSDFRWYTIQDQPAVRERMVEIERDFWRRVEEGLAPNPDWTHPETPALVALLNRPQPGVTVQLDQEALLWAEAYYRLGREASGLEHERAKCKARLIEAMGGAETAHLPGGGKIVRKLSRRNGYTVAPGDVESFRVTGIRTKPDEEMI